VTPGAAAHPQHRQPTTQHPLVAAPFHHPHKPHPADQRLRDQPPV